MPEYAQRQKQPQGTLLINPARSSRTMSQPVYVANPLLAQQQALGNHVMQRFVQSCPLALPSPSLCPFGGVCHTCPAQGQAKLKIGQLGDKYEQEADKVADQVMRMPAPQPLVGRMPPGRTRLLDHQLDQGYRDEVLRRTPLAEDLEELLEELSGRETQETRPSSFRDDKQRQRRQEEIEQQLRKIREQRRREEEIEQLREELFGPLTIQPSSTEEKGKGYLQTPEAPGRAAQSSMDLESQIQCLRGQGRSLTESVRAFFEPRFGYDFSQVRIHTDSRAANSARALNARAYTVGCDIVFGMGQYAPGQLEGKRLLAHELAHTVQQTVTRRPGNSTPGTTEVKDSARPGVVNTLSHHLHIQRSDDPILWCDAFVRLVEYEDQHGTLATVLRYNPLNNDLLVPLNYDIPSIYGDVDVDWMLRLTYTQIPTFGSSIFSPAIAQMMGLALSHIHYLGAKAFWNIVRSISDRYDFELSSIFQTANIRAPAVVVHWIQGQRLRQIFAPALAQCT